MNNGDALDEDMSVAGGRIVVEPLIDPEHRAVDLSVEVVASLRAGGKAADVGGWDGVPSKMRPCLLEGKIAVGVEDSVVRTFGLNYDGAHAVGDCVETIDESSLVGGDATKVPFD